MSVLEFIRRNSIFVLIVIAGVGVGLVMQDYMGKGSMLRRDFYVQVNGTGYSYPEITGIGEQGEFILSQLYNETNKKLLNQFDANQDEKLDETELVAQQAYLGEHPEFEAFIGFTNDMLRLWSSGSAKHSSVNVAVKRLILQEEGKALGITPSKEQIDAYIQAMPVFRTQDGAFDQQLYQRLSGYEKGTPNNAQEKAFRSVVSDMMVWEGLSKLLTYGVHGQGKTASDIVDMLMQSMEGKTAWLPASAAPAPAEPSEDDVKDYWEKHKESYKSETRRIISLYTLTPGENTSIADLVQTAGSLIQDVMFADGKGFDNIVKKAAENNDFGAFNYLTPEGTVHTTYPLCTIAEVAPVLKTQIIKDGKPTTLADIAFNDVESAPTVAQYEEAVKNGTAEQLPRGSQIRGYFRTSDNKIFFLRVEAEVRPAVLPYEEARESALADLKKERADKALEIAAQELYTAMENALAENGIDAAFAKAAEAHAEISSFGPVGIATETAEGLPNGLEPLVLLSVPGGKMAPLVILPDGARFTVVTERKLQESAQLAVLKMVVFMPMQNSCLSGGVLQDWLNDAYGRYNVLFSENVELNVKLSEK